MNKKIYNEYVEILRKSCFRRWDVIDCSSYAKQLQFRLLGKTESGSANIIKNVKCLLRSIGGIGAGCAGL